MKPKGYLVFHMNLAFSSIEKEARKDVINICYHPLLDLIEKCEIPIGIEITAWTLLEIKLIDPAWIDRFKILLSSGICELIGSGYSQIIGPLVPYTINEWNQKLGINYYKKILGIKPNIVLVNEMAFSTSLIDLYKKFDYKGLIMDRSNIRLTLGSDTTPTHLKGLENSQLPVLWSDSILFQKFQNFAHGNISISDYLNYLNKLVSSGEQILPIYCNDAEVFDYRPGRFDEEKVIHHEGEWSRLKNLLNIIVSDKKIELVLPTEALRISSNNEKTFSYKILDAAYPIPVKKQGKYNIARWAVTGRNDLWLNTMCHRVEKHLSKLQIDNQFYWQELCELWASDLRTHITDKRWIEAKEKLNNLLNQLNIERSFGEIKQIECQYDPLEKAIGKYGDSTISIDKDRIFLTISTKNTKLKLNMKRGLAIDSLAFDSHNMKPCIGTIPHGYFSCISAGADYYSGATVIELPTLRKRITDLEDVEPFFLIKKNGDILIKSSIDTKFGNLTKVIEISLSGEKVSTFCHFINQKKVISVVRSGTVTLLDNFFNKNIKILCANGGEKEEMFNIKSEFNHSDPASTIVSSSRGFGATTGKIRVFDEKKGFSLEWDPSIHAAMPMMQNRLIDNKRLTRIFFSTQEIDDTVKKGNNFSSFGFSISPIKFN